MKIHGAALNIESAAHAGDGDVIQSYVDSVSSVDDYGVGSGRAGDIPAAGGGDGEIAGGDVETNCVRAEAGEHSKRK